MWLIGAIRPPPTAANSAVRRRLRHELASMCWHATSPATYEHVMALIDLAYARGVSMLAMCDIASRGVQV